MKYSTAISQNMIFPFHHYASLILFSVTSPAVNAQFKIPSPNHKPPSQFPTWTVVLVPDKLFTILVPLFDFHGEYNFGYED
jgi:hypothetical protein